MSDASGGGPTSITIRPARLEDLRYALAQGWADFRKAPLNQSMLKPDQAKPGCRVHDINCGDVNNAETNKKILLLRHFQQNAGEKQDHSNRAGIDGVDDGRANDNRESQILQHSSHFYRVGANEATGDSKHRPRCAICQMTLRNRPDLPQGVCIRGVPQVDNQEHAALQ